MNLLTILIPTYNRKKILGYTINHLLERFGHLPNFEIIVSDNGSSESPRYIVESIQDKRIIYVENEKNIGISNNIIRASQLAKGRYLWIFGDDDLIDKKAINPIISLMQSEESFNILQIPRKNFVEEQSIKIFEGGEEEIKVLKMDLNKNLKKIDSDFGFISSNILLTDSFHKVIKMIQDRDKSLLNNNYLVKLINYELYKLSGNSLMLNTELVYQRINEASSFYKTPELIFKTFFKDLNDLLVYHKRFNPEFSILRKIYFRRNLDILIIKLYHPSNFDRLFKIFGYTDYKHLIVLFVILTPKNFLKKVYFTYKKYRGSEIPYIFTLNEN